MVSDPYLMHAVRSCPKARPFIFCSTYESIPFSSEGKLSGCSCVTPALAQIPPILAFKMVSIFTGSLLLYTFHATSNCSITVPSTSTRLPSTRADGTQPDHLV